MPAGTGTAEPCPWVSATGMTATSGFRRWGEPGQPAVQTAVSARAGRRQDRVLLRVGGKLIVRQGCADQPGPVAGQTCAADPVGGRSGAGGQPSGHGYGQIV